MPWERPPRLVFLHGSFGSAGRGGHGDGAQCTEKTGVEHSLPNSFVLSFKYVPLGGETSLSGASCTVTMLRCSRLLHSRYVPIVGRTFLVEQLYGSKYSPHLGTSQMPFVFVKTLLLCASGQGLSGSESRYIRGLIESLLPSGVSEGNLTTQELMQLVDAMPVATGSHVLDDGEHVDTEAPSGELSKSGPSSLVSYYTGESYAPTAATGEEVEDMADDLNSEPGRIGSGSSHALSGERGGERAVSFISPAAFPATMARVLLYDAVSACVADGLYTVTEKERVAMVATRVGLSSAVREHIERLVLQEKVVGQRKRRALHGGSGVPASSQTATLIVPERPEAARELKDAMAYLLWGRRDRRKGGCSGAPPPPVSER